ncbi:unnamed protein product [Clonostachys solani]|uniref:Uncharacterized protein n=1 Tax=Clonostachys solani TaxID=160281 RepID=A0A9N9ZPP6_9HYPO|nr:unnamed protein product [Clonostachys solani]
MPRHSVAPSKQPGPWSQTALRKEQPDTRFLSTGYVSSQSAGLACLAWRKERPVPSEYREDRHEACAHSTVQAIPRPKGTPSKANGWWAVSQTAQCILEVLTRPRLPSSQARCLQLLQRLCFASNAM